MIRHLSRFAISAVLVVGLQGCGDKKQEASEQPVRGLRAYKVAAKAESRVRRFPSVLQPADVSSLSFEIGGQLKAVTLTSARRCNWATCWRKSTRARCRARSSRPAPACSRPRRSWTTRRRFPAQGRAPEARRRDAGRLRPVEGHSAQLQGAARPGAPPARVGKSQPRPQQAAGAVRRHHRPRRGQILCPGRRRAADRHALQRRPVRDVVSGAVGNVPEPEGRTDGRRQGRRHAGPPAQRRDQGARVQSRAGVGLSRRRQAGQQRPGSERGHVGRSHDRGTADRRRQRLSGAAQRACARRRQGAADYGDRLSSTTRASSTVKKRNVTVGGVRDNRLVVTEGIAAGDIVASAGVSYLSDGQKVKLLPLQE